MTFRPVMRSPLKQAMRSPFARVSGGSAAPATPVTMVLFAGQSQSNSNGTTGVDVLAAVSGPMTDIWTWDPYGNQWVTYEAGVTSALHLKAGLYPDLTLNYWGAEAEFCRRWKVDNPGVPLYIFKYGFSSTSLSQVARTALRGCWDPALVGDLWTTFVQYVANAKANLVAAGKSPVVRSMNWIQGENDANDATAAAAYQTNLNSFIDALRANGTLSSSSIFNISRIQFSGWTNPVPVRTAQATIGETKQFCRWVDADSLTTPLDGIHYGPASVVSLGTRMYDAQLTGTEVTAKYVAKMSAAPTAPRQALLATYFQSLIDTSVWPAISYMLILASHDAQSSLVNAQAQAMPGTPANSGMTFAADRGYTGTSTASFFNTSVNPQLVDLRMTRDTAAYSIYIRGLTASTGFDLGFVDGAQAVLLTVFQSGANTFFRLNTAAVTADNTYAGPADWSGLSTMNRSSQTNCTYWNKGALLKTDAVSSAPGLANQPVHVGNRANGGGQGTLRQYGLFIAGGPRTVNQEAALNTATVAYLAAIGAN